MLGGKTLWVVSTAAMMVGIPWALAFTEEAQMVEMEKEMRMQQTANEVCLSLLFPCNGHGMMANAFVADWVRALVAGARRRSAESTARGPTRCEAGAVRWTEQSSPD